MNPPPGIEPPIMLLESLLPVMPILTIFLRVPRRGLILTTEAERKLLKNLIKRSAVSFKLLAIEDITCATLLSIANPINLTK
jgi:hypothetical protein